MATAAGNEVNAEPLGVAGAWVLEAPVWGDDRGFFREWFRHEVLAEHGVDFVARQTNLSSSIRDVVRGLHYSLAPEGQAKVVTCAFGDVLDVLVDVRVGSPTYGVVASVDLVAEQGRSVYLPSGVAHGFCVRSEIATLTYLLSSPYNPSVELEINPFDPELAVQWPTSGPAILSEKDRAAPDLAQRRAALELPRFE